MFGGECSVWWSVSGLSMDVSRHDLQAWPNQECLMHSGLVFKPANRLLNKNHAIRPQLSACTVSAFLKPLRLCLSLSNFQEVELTYVMIQQDSTRFNKIQPLEFWFWPKQGFGHHHLGLRIQVLWTQENLLQSEVPRRYNLLKKNSNKSVLQLPDSLYPT